jgi:toxin ParE1/3/4
MKLRINPIVAEDLKNIREYIAEDNEEMAVKTIQEIYDRIENIQQFPYMGADLAKRVSFRTDYKYVICGNYVVLYKIGEEYVEIYRVVNRYQDITKIFLWCEEGDFMNKNLYSGKLIAVDGPNGAGKTTIIQELKKELEKRRIKACFTKEPTDNKLGCFVREWIK